MVLRSWLNIRINNSSPQYHCAQPCSLSSIIYGSLFLSPFTCPQFFIYSKPFRLWSERSNSHQAAIPFQLECVLTRKHSIIIQHLPKRWRLPSGTRTRSCSFRVLSHEYFAKRTPTPVGKGERKDMKRARRSHRSIVHRNAYLVTRDHSGLLLGITWSLFLDLKQEKKRWKKCSQ